MDVTYMNFLETFEKRYNEDDNAWWIFDSGQHQILFDTAITQRDEARAEVERLREELGLMNAAVESLKSFRLCQAHYGSPDNENHGYATCVICLVNRAEKSEAEVERVNSQFARLRDACLNFINASVDEDVSSSLWRITEIIQETGGYDETY